MYASGIQSLSLWLSEVGSKSHSIYKTCYIIFFRPWICLCAAGAMVAGDARPVRVSSRVLWCIDCLLYHNGHWSNLAGPSPIGSKCLTVPIISLVHSDTASLNLNADSSHIEIVVPEFVATTHDATPICLDLDPTDVHGRPKFHLLSFLF